MTKNQLQRLSRAVLADRVLDLEASLKVSQVTAAEPPAPADAARALLLAARDRAAGLVLALIDLGEATYAMCRRCRRGVGPLAAGQL
jgi:hypothetical protein